MNRVAEVHNLSKEIRTMAEALEDSRHLLSAGVGAPFVIHLRHFPGRLGVFDKFDLAKHPLLRDGMFGLRLIGHASPTPLRISRKCNDSDHDDYSACGTSFLSGREVTGNPHNLLVFLFDYRRIFMSFVDQPQITLTETSDYRDTYANSVQIRMSVWDFHLAFGTLQSQAENRIEVRNFQGIYLSPQQAKALTLMLQQNLANYEQAFGEIKLDPNMAK